jgi:hypothetical protein
MAFQSQLQLAEGGVHVPRDRPAADPAIGLALRPPSKNQVAKTHKQLRHLSIHYVAISIDDPLPAITTQIYYRGKHL